MTVLIENVRHHVEEEEKEWFPQVRSALGRNRLGELGEQLATAKPDAPATPPRAQRPRMTVTTSEPTTDLPEERRHDH